MTKNRTKKIAISLINNSFTENLLPFLNVYDGSSANKKVTKPRFTVQTQFATGKTPQKAKNDDNIFSWPTVGAALQKRLATEDFYGISFSQKIKKAESQIVKQYLRQLETTSPFLQKGEDHPQFLNSHYTKKNEYNKVKSSSDGSRGEPSPSGSTPPKEASRRGRSNANKNNRPEGRSDLLFPRRGERQATQTILNQSKAPILSNLDFLYKHKKSPFSVLLSVEHIRNAILSKRSVKTVGQTENTKSTRSTRLKLLSELKKQIYECRKIRLLYGNLSKKDLNRSAVKAKSMYGVLGENILLILETRLDVTLHRCGFFSTIKAAKQSVIHKRITINNIIVDLPSYQMQAGDIIKINSSNVARNFLKGDATFKVSQKDNLPLKDSFSFFRPVELNKQVKRSLRWKQRRISMKQNEEAKQRKQEFFIDNKNSTTFFKNQKYLYYNNTKDFISIPSERINEIVNERSLQWRYVASVDMIWYFLHLQYNILLPLLIYCYPHFNNKVGFLVKTKSFIKNYYQDRLNLTKKQNPPFFYKINDSFIDIDKQPKCSNEKSELHSLSKKVKKHNCFWTKYLGLAQVESRELTSSVYNRFSSIPSGQTLSSGKQKFEFQKAKNSRLQNYSDDIQKLSYWLDLCKKNIFLGCASLSTKKQLHISQNKKSDNTINLKKTHFKNNFDKSKVCLCIGSALNSMKKTLCSMISILGCKEFIPCFEQTIITNKKEKKRNNYNCNYEYHFFFHLFCFGLLMQKKLISLSNRVPNFNCISSNNLHADSTSKVIPYQNSLEYYKYKKKSKVLHLEVSYPALCAIYLYTPQRIHLPAVINLDILRKAFY